MRSASKTFTWLYYLLCGAAILMFMSFNPMVLGASKVWHGGGANDYWTTPGNWLGGVAPVLGDNLEFPRAATNYSPVNDFPAGNAFGSITVSNGYHLSGAPISLTGGITSVSTSTVSIGLPITLAGSQTFTNSSLTAIQFSDGTIDLNGYTLTIGGFVNVASPISGTGNLVKQGNRQVSLFATNSYTGITDVREGTLLVYTDGALGSTAGGTVVRSNAALQLVGIGSSLRIKEPLDLYGTLVSAGPFADTTNYLLGSVVVYGSPSALSGTTPLVTDSLSGSGSLVCDDLQIFEGTNSYTGPTILNVWWLMACIR